MRHERDTAWGRYKGRILAGFYLLALLAVLFSAAAEPLLFRLGAWEERALTLADFTATDIEWVDGSTVITTGNDSQLLLEGGRMHSLWVRCDFSANPGEFVAFYQTGESTAFDAHKLVYAERHGDWYVFPLPWGTRHLRLDLGIFPSVTVHFNEIVLNRRTPPAITPGAVFWAVVLPGFAWLLADTLALALARYRPRQAAAGMGRYFSIEAWRHNARRICIALYGAAALAVLAAMLVDPILFRLGVLRQRELTLADFTPVGVELVDAATVTTASDDSQLLLQAEGMHTLWVRCTFSSPPGEFTAFYQKDATAPFSVRKMVYAEQYGDWYLFRLPYGTANLRLDLGIFPSVTVQFKQIVLNRQAPITLLTGALMWAAILPGLLFAVADWCVALWQENGTALLRRQRLHRYRKKGHFMTVTKDTVIADILQNDPLRESVAIFLSAGMHCLGCVAAHGETVAEACEVHGVDADALIGELNAYFAKLAG